MVDSLQISHDYGRDEKELWNSNGLGAQLWNNIRALDLLCEMPFVDSANIGVTGASGGGSQTLFLALLDERVKAAAPINMISLEMQGGCQCENAAGLRRDTDNCEMCSLIAPRHLFMAGSTGDWTRSQEVLEYPAVRDVYKLYGAEDRLEHYYQVAGHQYNARTRSRVYGFFARSLMGRDISWEEQPVVTDDIMSFTWFRGAGHAPGFNNDDEYFHAFRKERAYSVSKLDTAEKRRMLSWIVGAGSCAPVCADGVFDGADGITLEKNVAMTASGAQIPFVRLYPKNWDGRRAVLALSGDGKDCADSDCIQQKLADGCAVISGDLFMTGETAAAERSIAGGDTAVRYFTTFNYTTAACRIQDVLTLWHIARATAPECTLWAQGAAAAPAACALPLMDDAVSAELDASGIELNGDSEYFEKFFVPGIMLLGGVEGCISMAKCPVKKF